MQSTLYKTSELAITNVEVVETVASFLTRYNQRHRDPFYYNYNK